MNQSPDNSDSQQPADDLSQNRQADSYLRSNRVEGNQNRVIQGNENQSVLGDHNIVVQIKELILGQQLVPVGNPARPKYQRLLLADVKKEVTVRLSQSLHNALLINLGKELQPQQVKRPWDADIKIGLKPAAPLSDTTTILEVFDSEEIAGKLLILGAPGSGKTTTQLELAQELIKRAEEQVDYPIPVLFNLSSWKNDRQPIADWLVAELKSKRGVSKKLGQEWVNNRQLLPLLDGLDELEPQRQEPCVQLINQFLASENRPPYLVVCSRIEEYSSYSNKLHFNGGIFLRELNKTQILEYFEAVGRVEFWQALQCDEALLKLVRTPLFLSITALSVQNLSIENWQQLETMEERIRYLFDAYWQQQINRGHTTELYAFKNRLRFFIDKYIRRLPVEPIIEPYTQHKPPTQKQTKLWLVWLAKQMQREAKTEFLIEEMQHNLLIIPSHKNNYRLILGLLFGINIGLCWMFVGYFTFGLNWGLFYGLFFGLMGGVQTATNGGTKRRLKIENIKIIEDFIFINKKEVSIGGITVFMGLFIGFMNGLVGGLFYGLSFGLVNVLIGLILWIRERQTSKTTILIRNFIFRNNQEFYTGRIGILYGLYIGLNFGVVGGLVWSLMEGILWGLMGGIFGLILGLFFEISSNQSISQGLENIELREKFVFRRKNEYFILALFLGLFLGLIVWLISERTSGLILGLSFGLILGLFVGFIGVQPELSIENKKFANQGIWKSAINSLFLGVIGVLIFGLILAFNFGMMGINNLIALGFQTIAAIGILLVCIGMYCGGEACVQHFTLRLVLYHSEYIPWNYARFLDYCTERLFLQRVGGRYRFIHKMLQDYFAQMEFKRD